MMQGTFRHRQETTWRASDLGAVADDFDARARHCDDTAVTTLGMTQRRQAELRAEAGVWRQAASILRRTTLVGDPPSS